MHAQMEAMDPGTVLMAGFGSMLALFWAAFFLCGERHLLAHQHVCL
jgi:hypothetical protein